MDSRLRGSKNGVCGGAGGSRAAPTRWEVVGIGEQPHLNLPPSRRPLRNFQVSPATAPITLTLILSQDGRGDKRDGDDGYAQVSIKEEEGEGDHKGRPYEG